MALDATANKALYLLAGMALLAAVAIATRWSDKRVDDPVKRLEREKREAKESIATLAKKDLACEAVEVREPAGELWAFGCEKKARYVPASSGGYAMTGDVEPDDQEGCAARWRADAGAGAAAGGEGDDAAGASAGAGADAGPSADAGAQAAAGLGAAARAAAEAARVAGKRARLRIPIGAFGVTGLTKLRYGELVDVFLDPEAGAVGDAVPVPCIDPTADGGVRAGRCARPWSEVVEVAECR